ncbi:MAG: hypothetical protein HQ494_09565 [Rhodospirillales bacterium]|nr:hypothetical protein [Rhodospirillales bacterium]
MPGMLSDFYGWLQKPNTPEQDALFSALLRGGAAGMAASGPSRMPVGFGQALGANMNAFQDSLDKSRGARVRDMSLKSRLETERLQQEALKRKAAASRAQMEGIAKYQGLLSRGVVPTGLDNADLGATDADVYATPQDVARHQRELQGAAMSAAPGQYFKNLYAKPTTRKVQRGNSVVAEEFVNGSWREVGTGPRFNPATGGTSLAQQANNREIETARDQVRNLSAKRMPGESLRDVAVRFSQSMSATGRANREHDPFMNQTLRTAMQAMTGGDPKRDAFLKSLDEKAGETSATGGPTALPRTGGRIDRRKLRRNSIYTLPDGRKATWDGRGFVVQE